MWREYLGVEEDFGPQDDFFDVGGTSSTITTVAGRRGERLAGAGSRRPWSSGTPPSRGLPDGSGGQPPRKPSTAHSGCQAANTWESSAKALNSRALPAGSSRNIVHCSPVSPAKRT
ncbi:acyl carrier protein [Streptomyces mirabilis]|uniref:acyl carrier protein n=1 Tax=Streptomyces mirabilis TaxID=68239 RepID=UPI0036B6FDF8